MRSSDRTPNTTYTYSIGELSASLNVVHLHGAAIVQQAQANAQIYQQNQQILATAQATMNNTAIAAKYAQISAINSEASLKLQYKELAYQKADFWLK